MPWDHTSTMDQKRLFIADYLTRSFTIVELCERYGVSRPTGYKWIRRFLNQWHQRNVIREHVRTALVHNAHEALTDALRRIESAESTWGGLDLHQEKEAPLDFP